MTKRAFDYIGETGYEHFVEDVSIFYKLEQLGLFKINKVFDYVLIEDDLNNIRQTIYANDPNDNSYFDELYLEFDNKYSQYSDLNIKYDLPFRAIWDMSH